MTLPGLQNPPQIATWGKQNVKSEFSFLSVCLYKVRLPVTPVPCIQIGCTHCLLSDWRVQSAINYPAVKPAQIFFDVTPRFYELQREGQAGWDTMSFDGI